MVRARLWYGPAGHELELERIARYLRGPLRCDASMGYRNRPGRRIEEISVIAPVSAVIVSERTPRVGCEAADLVSRLPREASPALAWRIAACTARLEVSDAPQGRRFAPAAPVSRSVLVPLAFALGGIVEEVEEGRLLFFAPPAPERAGFRPLASIAWLARNLIGMR